MEDLETSPETPQQDPAEAPKLKDLLVSMRLPGDVQLGEGTPSTGFSPEIQAELDAKLAKMSRWICDPREEERRRFPGRFTAH